MRLRWGALTLCLTLIFAAAPATASAGSSSAAKRFEAAVADVPLAATAKKKCKKKHGKARKRCKKKRVTDFYLDYSRAFQIAVQDAALALADDPNGTGSGVVGCTRLSRIELRCLAFYNFNKPAPPDMGPWQCNWIVNVALATDGSNRTGYFRTNFNCYPTA